MIRDMDLIRKILLKIEEKHDGSTLFNLKIEDYGIKVMAYHCDLLYQAGLVNWFEGHTADDELCFFAVGALSWEGHNYLDLIRDETVWNNTKSFLKKNGLPLTIENVKEVASKLYNNMLNEVIDKN